MKKHIYILVLVLAVIFSACKKNTLDVRDFGRVTIDSISPGTGPSGSHVVVYGRNFSYKASEAKVRINDMDASITEISPERMIIFLPAGASSGRLSFFFDRTNPGSSKYNYGGQVDSTAEGPLFVVNETLSAMPIVKSVDPMHGKAGDVIQITGYNFSTVTDVCKVMFGGVQAEITQISQNGISVKVPVTTPDTVALSIHQDPYTIDATPFIVEETPKGVKEIYWVQTDAFGSKIRKAVMDALGNLVSEDLYTSADGLNYLDRGVKADVANGFLYWADGEKIFKGSTDGTLPPQLIYTDPVAAFDLDLDGTGNLYFASWSSSNGNNHSIKRIKTDGSGIAEELYFLPADATPIGLKVDVASSKIYWVEISTVSAYEGSINGHTVQPAKLLYDAADGLAAPLNIALDPGNSRIFIFDGGVGSISAGALDGSGTLKALPVAAADILSVVDIEIDPANQFIYWIKSSIDDGSLMRCKTDGSGAQKLFNLPAGYFLDLVL